MNRITIIGNVTRTPELRATASGKQVCTFTVAVNRRGNGQNEADFFRVSAWEKLGVNCAQYLDKGRKVAVQGSVSAQAYTDKDGKPRASIEIMAHDVEFLTAATQATTETEYVKQEREAIRTEAQQGFTAVESEDLPF